jgi:hypothetical protein
LATQTSPIVDNQDRETLLTEYELARRWRVPVSFLRRRRSLGLGPEYLKLGMHVRYPLASAQQFWEESRRGAK